MVVVVRHLNWNRDAHRTRLRTTSTRLEAVHLQLLRLGQTGLGQPLANVLALVTLQLQNLAVFRVFHNRAVARKFLSQTEQGRRTKALLATECGWEAAVSPFYMPGRSSSGHTRRRGPAPW